MARQLKIPWHEAFHRCIWQHTDAPSSFITWGAISLIGAALKNNVFFEIGTYTLYPNQFVVLVAPPGIGKGTVMTFVEQIVNENKGSPAVNILPDRVTAERIIELIADGWPTPLGLQGQQLVVGPNDHNCLLFSTELRVLLGSSQWMLEFLEEAWSKTTFKYQTKNKGNVTIDTMCCSLLAASVPDFLKNANKEIALVISGGFTSRCLFIYAEEQSKDLPWPEPLKKNVASKALYDDLVHDLKEISTLRGDFKVSAGARILFEDFLKKNRAAASRDDSEAVANFRARVKAHVLKLAMVLSASRSNNMVISDIDMQNSISEIQKVTKTLELLFRGAGDSLDASAAARVENVVDTYGMVSKKELLRILRRHVTSETLDRVLFVLTHVEVLVTQEQNKITYYKRKVKP